MEKSQQQSKAQKLLLEYRSTIWRKTALETVLGTGHKALLACIEQIHFTQELTLSLRSNKLLGEKLYWIIYALYDTYNMTIVIVFDEEPTIVQFISPDGSYVDMESIRYRHGSNFIQYFLVIIYNFTP